MKLVKAMATVGGLTGLSRVAGFIRDIMTANVLGASPVADAFFVALKLPNLFRRITAEGAFSVSFVPLYSERLEKEGRESASSFAANSFSVMFWSLLLITSVIVILMPYVVWIIAPGFFGDVTRYANAVEMSRVTFPYLLLMSLASLMGGILNAHNRFAPFAAAPIIFNLTLVAALFMAGFFKTAGHALSWGVFFAGVLQCLFLWKCLKRAKLDFNFVWPKFSDPAIMRLLKLMGPGVLGAGVMHINLFADMMMASFLEIGSISALYYADRLNQLPLGMVGIAVGTALLPMMSRAVSAGHRVEARHLFNRALEVCALLALPAAVGLFMASYPIIMTLFHHGEFGDRSAALTTSVLTAYALGIPAYVAVKVLSTSYWARQDTVTPVRAAIASTVCNIVIGLFLIFVLKVGVMGIAAATAIAGWLQLGLLMRGLRGNEDTRLDERCKKALVKIVASCGVMAVFVYGARLFFETVYQGDDTLPQILALGGIIGGGVLVYGLCVFALGVVKLDDLRKHLRDKTPPAAPPPDTTTPKEGP